VSRTIVIAQQVSQMASSGLWSDVRLLSFDLRVIQLEYCRGYGLTVTCCASSAIKPTYDLQFFRVDESKFSTETSALNPPKVNDANPHRGIATWAARVLAGKNLSRNVRILTYCLRTSIPVLLELDALSSSGDVDVCWFPKGLVWWRALFRNSSFGLDFRIRPDFFLEVVDIGSLEGAQQAFKPNFSVMMPIPDIHQICRLVSISHSALPLAPFESGILIPCFRNPQTSREVLRSLFNLIRGAVGS